jgi:hypothetical protein
LRGVGRTGQGSCRSARSSPSRGHGARAVEDRSKRLGSTSQSLIAPGEGRCTSRRANTSAASPRARKVGRSFHVTWRSEYRREWRARYDARPISFADWQGASVGKQSIMYAVSASGRSSALQRWRNRTRGPLSSRLSQPNVLRCAEPLRSRRRREGGGWTRARVRRVLVIQVRTVARALPGSYRMQVAHT